MQAASGERWRYLSSVSSSKRGRIEAKRQDLAKKQQFAERQRQFVKDAARIRVWLRQKEQGRLRSRSQPLPQFDNRAPSKPVDTRLFYTGGPPGKRPSQQHHAKVKAALKIQRSWRQFKARWRKALVECRNTIEEKQQRLQQAMVAQQETLAQERERASKLVSEYKAHPERFTDNEDAKLIHI